VSRPDPKGSYLITTANNIRISVKNSKDALVDAALKPLVGASVNIAGTHRLGAVEITVTGVNGAALQEAPVAAPTSTTAAGPTSTTSTASSTTPSSTVPVP
jgi:hypothetical protein